MSIEAMKQMVEALEAYQHNGSVQLFDEAITTGRQAIAEAEKHEVSQEPVALKPIYYMRDNHTFKRLSDDVSKALVEIEQEFNEGWTYGSLCSKREKQCAEIADKAEPYKSADLIKKHFGVE